MSGMLNTIQGTYEPLRPETGEVDGTLSVNAWDWTAKPSTAFRTGPEWNSMEMIFKFPSDATANDDADGNIFGYVENGPKEWIAEISVTAGTATIGADAASLYGDTIVIGSQGHPTTVSVSDSATNRAAKLTFDILGYKYISVEFTAAGCFTGTIQPFGRPW